MPRNFVATVKESLGECPFHIHLEPCDPIATAGHTVVLRLEPNATLEEARMLAATLNGRVQDAALDDLDFPSNVARLMKP